MAEQRKEEEVEKEEVLVVTDTDDIWNRIGQFGKFQWIFFFLASMQRLVSFFKT